MNEPLYPIPERTTGPGHELPFHIKSRRRKVRRTLLAAAVVAVLVALTCIPVLGDANLFQLVAHWTTEQFSFRVMEDGSSSVASADPDPVPEEFGRVPGPGRRKGFNTCHACDSRWVLWRQSHSFLRLLSPDYLRLSFYTKVIIILLYMKSPKWVVSRKQVMKKPKS